MDVEQPAVYPTLPSARTELDEPVVTIGNFDGVHLGHQEIFERTHRHADRLDTAAVALTFVPHPVRYFRPETDEFRISTDQHKFELMIRHGLDGVVALPFDEQLASLEPAAFVDEIIADGLDASVVVVGTNFRFGRKRAGSTDDLERLAAERDIETEIVSEVERDGEVVSSTRIRKLLREGAVNEAAQLLTRPHRVCGTVVHGEKRGRTLGYPTANIDPENLIPANGIYATRLHVDGQPPLPAASSIGIRPTFDGEERRLESFVLDRDDLDLYDAEVEVEFIEYVRPEESFDSADALVSQMDDDVEAVRNILDAD